MDGVNIIMNKKEIVEKFKETYDLYSEKFDIWIKNNFKALEQYENKRNDLLKWIDWINKNSKKKIEERNDAIMNYFISLGYYTDLNYFCSNYSNGVNFTIFLTDPNSDKNE